MKKVVLFFLLVCITFGSLPIVNAEQTNVSISDETRSYFLGLGVLEEKDFENLDKPMTRKDAIKLVVNLLGYDAFLTSFTTSTFADVSNDSEYVPYIETAKQLGLIKGDENGNFNPEKEMTLEQYACILIRAMGYGEIAESRGGYMQGYTDLAMQFGLFRKIKPGGNIKANFYIVTESAFEVNLLTLLEHNAIEHETLLESVMHRLNLITGEGIVYGNEIYPLDSTVDMDEEQVKIGNKVFKKGNMDIAPLIGQKVRYFAKDFGGWYEITQAFNEDFNNILYVKGVDVADFDGSTLSYYNNDNKKKKLSIDTLNHFYLVNNRPVDTLSDADFTGTIKLIDNDNDNKYEVVSIEDSTTHKIIEINPKLGQISLQKEDWYETGDMLALSDLYGNNEEKEVVILNATGEKIAFSELKVGDVIDICVSRDKKYIKISLNQNMIEGRISLIGRGNSVTLGIGQNEYDVSVSSKGIPAFDGSYLNDEGKFYLNSNNEIVYYEKNINSKKYAYIAALSSKPLRFTEEAEVKFVLPGGIKYVEKTYDDGTTEKYLNASNDSVQIFAFAERVKVDDIRHDAEDALDWIQVGEIIEYSLNADGQIKTINHPMSYYDGDSKSHYRKFLVFNDASASNEKDKRVFSFSGVNKGGFRVTSEDTAVFCVPPFDDERYTITGDANYSIESDDDYLDRVRMNNGTQYYTRAYEFKEEDGIAYVFAIVSGLNANRSDDVLNSESWSILTDKRCVIDEYGDVVYELTGYTDGKPFEILSQSGDVGGFGRAIEDLKIGDVFKYTLNTQDRIYAVSDREDIFSITADIPDYYSGLYSLQNGNIYGSTLDIKRKFIHETTGMYASTLDIDYGMGAQNINIPYATSAIYYFDLGTKEISVATQNQIYSSLETGGDSSWIYAKLDSGQNAEIVVIVGR